MKEWPDKIKMIEVDQLKEEVMTEAETVEVMTETGLELGIIMVVVVVLVVVVVAVIIIEENNPMTVLEKVREVVEIKIKIIIIMLEEEIRVVVLEMAVVVVVVVEEIIEVETWVSKE